MPPKGKAKAKGSQQSISMPSTPNQRARRGSGSRSPSPRGLSETQSPLAPGFGATPASGPVEMLSFNGRRPACRYELNHFLLGRRRMQYNIGDALLDSPVYIKESLTPEEDKKLTADTTALYNRLLPTPDSERRRALFIGKLLAILRKEWPRTEFKAHVFGSSGNLLCTSDSDVDLCIQTPMTELRSMHQIAAVLDRNGMERVVCVPAKVPIVKMWDPELDMAADINVNNTLALENTRMVKSYVLLDERVRPLAMIIKQWARQRALNDAGPGGTISSYAWICMIINFLQTREPPILPALQLRAHRDYFADDGSEAGFDDKIKALEGFGRPNSESLGKLLFDFFRYYSFEFNYEESVVCVRKGKPIPRKEKGWVVGVKDGHWRLCVEEPFNQSRNLGNSCDATSFRGIHIELRTAFLAVSKQDLEKLMVPYEFKDLKEEKEGFKKAPVSMAAPTPSSRNNPSTGSVRITRSSDKAANGVNGTGGSVRAAPSGPSNRRSSSGAAYGRFNGPYPSNQNQFPANSEYYTADGVNSMSIQQWQAIVKAQARAHAVQSIATAHAHNVISGGSHPLLYTRSMASSRQPIYISPAETEPIFVPQAQAQQALEAQAQNILEAQLQQMMVPTAPVLHPPYYPGGYVFAVPADQPQQMPQSPPDGWWTLPSSPSFAPAVMMVGESQPSLYQPPHLVGPMQVGFNQRGIAVYAIPVDTPAGWSTDFSYYTYATDSGTGGSVENRPKEYVGYYWAVPRTRQMDPPPPNAALNIPPQPDLAQRLERTHRPMPINHQPSSSHTRHYSNGLRSAPLPNSSARLDQSLTDVGSPPSNHNNPPIVNGSSLPDGPRTDAELITPDALQYVASANGRSHLDHAANPLHQSTASSDYHAARQGSDGVNVSGMPPGPPMALDPTSPHAPYATPTQAFPAYVDSGVTAARSPQPAEPSMSPRSHYDPRWQSLAPNFLVPLGSNEAKELISSSRSQSLAVLSPVMETRTPLLMSHRQTEGAYYPRPAVATGSSSSSRGGAGAATASADSWQQVFPGKRRNHDPRRRSKSVRTVAEAKAEAAEAEAARIAAKEAADRRAAANAKVRALPNAAASRANSRIQEVLSEEDEDDEEEDDEDQRAGG